MTSVIRVSTRKSMDDVRGMLPRDWHPHMRIMLLRHLKVAIGDYGWALQKAQLSSAERRDIVAAKAEAEEIVTVLEGK